jgi:hypothetical protein
LPTRVTEDAGDGDADRRLSCARLIEQGTRRTRPRSSFRAERLARRPAGIAMAITHGAFIDVRFRQRSCILTETRRPGPAPSAIGRGNARHSW